MTVSNTNNRGDFVAAGGVENFDYTFDCFDEDHILVYADGVLQTMGPAADYTVNLTLKRVTTVAPGFGVGDVVIIVREVPLEQLTDYVAHDAFPAETHERALDLLCMMAQQMSEIVDRMVRVPITSLLTDLEIPEGATQLIGWDAAGTGLALYNVITDVGVITTQGDLIRGSVGGDAERYPIGAAGDLLRVNAAQVDWEAPTGFKLDDWGATDDNTDLDATTAKHGLMSKLDKVKLDAHKRRITLPAACFETRSGVAAWAAFVQTQGTNIDYGELDFDAASQEKVISPPIRLTNWNGASLTLRIGWKAAAIAGDVIWSFYRLGTAVGEAWDAALVSTDLAATTVAGTTEYLNESVYTGIPGGWANNDAVIICIQRMATAGGDTMVGDAKLLYAELEYTEI